LSQPYPKYTASASKVYASFHSSRLEGWCPNRTQSTRPRPLKSTRRFTPQDWKADVPTVPKVHGLGLWARNLNEPAYHTPCIGYLPSNMRPLTSTQAAHCSIDIPSQSMRPPNTLRITYLVLENAPPPPSSHQRTSEAASFSKTSPSRTRGLHGNKFPRPPILHHKYSYSGQSKPMTQPSRPIRWNLPSVDTLTTECRVPPTPEGSLGNFPLSTGSKNSQEGNIGPKAHPR